MTTFTTNGRSIFFALVVVNVCLLTAGNSSARPQSRFVSVNGIRLHYLEWGRAGSPIVLVHGMYDSARIWSSVAPLLAKKHRVIAVDRRGAGRSSKTENGYDHETLTRDLTEFIEKLNLGSVTLIGHSAGGEVALMTAATSPKLIDSLVLVEGGFFPKREAPADGALPVPPCEALPLVCRQRALLEKASREYDAEKLYPQATMPVLLVTGIPPVQAGIDPARLKESQQHVAMVAEQKLSNGKMALVKNAAHWIQQDQPVKLAKVIGSFLAGVKR